MNDGVTLKSIAHPGSRGLTAEQIERIEAEQEKLGQTDPHDFGDSIETVELDLPHTPAKDPT